MGKMMGYSNDILNRLRTTKKVLFMQQRVDLYHSYGTVSLVVRIMGLK